MINKCLYCQKETHNPKYCSRSCYATHTNTINPKRKTDKKCIDCGAGVKSYRFSRCEKHRKEYNETKFEHIQHLSLEHYWAKLSLQNLHASSKNAHIRRLARTKFKDLTKKPCAHCGYDKHVELCHIKPIKDFSPSSTIKEVNNHSNIIQLCPNCHWEFDNQLKLKKYYRTPGEGRTQQRPD